MYSGNKHTQSSKQAQTVDQNYANNILFIAMSTMEALAIKLKNKSGNPSFNLKPQNKEFGAYDVYDYSYKQYEELRSQLIQHVMLLAHSRKGFDSVYGTGAYSLPSNYNTQMVLHRLNQFKIFFQQVGSSDCYSLANDMYLIISQNKTSGLSCQNMKANDAYQNNYDQKKFLSNIMFSANQMHQEEKRVAKNYGLNANSSDLKFKQNPNYTSNQISQTTNFVNSGQQNYPGYSQFKNN